MSASAPIGEYARLVERTRRIAAANPRLRKKLGIADNVVLAAKKPDPAPPPTASAISEIITVVARVAQLRIVDIAGDANWRHLTHARYAIANLAEEFAPKLSERSVAYAMNKSDTLAHYYRVRHVDRLEMFPAYLAMYEECRAILLRKGALALLNRDGEGR